MYLNDILIFSKDMNEHIAHVKAVLDRLRRFSLFTKPSKCDFSTDQVDFLGFAANADGDGDEPGNRHFGVACTVIDSGTVGILRLC
jgi:Reverse transcriptase (RNA-dependent DNA polymerase)